jgi:hypothetical protein
VPVQYFLEGLKDRRKKFAADTVARRRSARGGAPSIREQQIFEMPHDKSREG